MCPKRGVPPRHTKKLSFTGVLNFSNLTKALVWPIISKSSLVTDLYVGSSKSMGRHLSPPDAAILAGIRLTLLPVSQQNLAHLPPVVFIILPFMTGSDIIFDFILFKILRSLLSKSLGYIPLKSPEPTISSCSTLSSVSLYVEFGLRPPPPAQETANEVFWQPPGMRDC